MLVSSIKAHDPFESLPETLVELLRLRAERQPDQIAYTFLRDGEMEEASLTYRELDFRARSIAQMLRGVEATGGKALLLYPAGLEFIAAFFGCLYAHVVAVPVYQPRLRRTLDRLVSIAADCNPSVVLTTEGISSRVKPLIARTPEMQSLPWRSTDNCGDKLAEQWSNPGIRSSTLALLQYTSGSTSAPKGVMITHDNLLHNEAMIQSVFKQDRNALIVGWLPLYHDMGLIGNVIQPMYAGARSVLMSPAAFLQAPARWLQAISRYRATTSGGPNFAYELCLRKVTDEQRQDLDLSSWSVAFNGAEPIRAETLERFASVFASCGFRQASFSPCYGMAEATLLISAKKTPSEPVIKCVVGAALMRGQVIDAATDEVDIKRLVSCGESLQDQTIAIVQPETSKPCDAGEIGEIWVSGPSIAQGYLNRPDATEENFQARLAGGDRRPYLRTGDLGFMHDKELFVTGRLKDLIIIRGLNHYPHDIELTMERSHPALRAGCGAAFAIDVDGVEKLVLVAEVEKRHSDENEIFAKIRRAVPEEHELEVHAIVLVQPNTIPKTSSGKIQRHACRTRFLEGALETVASWQQSQREMDATTVNLSVDSTQAVEVWLAANLANICGEEPTEVDVTRTLAQFGLDSLMAVDLMHRFERDSGVVLPMSFFLDDLSVRELAERIAEESTVVTNSSPLLSTSLADQSSYPLSKGQQALWGIYKRHPDSSAYNISTALRIKSPLDVAALSSALIVLIERHSLLRTVFFSERGEPFQRTNEHNSACFEEFDATTWTQAELAERLNDAANRPFDLECEPLLRVTLYKRSAREYVLLAVIHHIISDFWSLAILMRELGTLYSAEAENRTATLAPLPLQYADFVEWQSRMLDSARGECLWSYWQTQLAGNLPVLNLVTDGQHPSSSTNEESSYRFKLDKETTQKLKALAHERSATLYMILLAAYQVLLHRYTGQNEILVGSPTTGRNRAELAGLIGYFTNLVVLRADFSGTPTFEKFLNQVRQGVLGALDHQDYPFSMLVARLREDHKLDVTPLFQAAFIMQKSALPELDGLASFAIGGAGSQLKMGALSFESVALKQANAQFDLALLAAESDGGISASLKYNTALYDGATIQRLATHFQNLVKSIIAEPQQPINALNLLSDSERQQMIVELNETRRDYPLDSTIPQRFEIQVERTPDDIAVRYEDQQLTYRELNERANQVAHHLRGLGVGPEVLVGLCMNRSVELIVALLGVLKAGGAYVPLDPQYPAVRLSLLIENTGMPVLLVQQPLLNTLPGSDIHMVSVDSDWPAIAQQSRNNPEHRATSQNAAYVIYTSGSTGEPKGVMISHDAICNRLFWMQEAYQLTGKDRVLQKTPYTFDVSVWEFFWPLLNGAQLIVARPGGHQNSWYLVRSIIEQEITVVHFVPSMLNAMLNEPRFEDCISLRQIVCSGEALPYASQEKVFASLQTTELHNLYGPTEAAVDVSHWTCERTGSLQIVPIGYPIANIRLHVLDQQQQPVPIGVPGELYIGGVGVARGYLKQPDLTAAKFVPDPHSSVPGARLYRTGDQVRYLSNGALVFLGRLDQQIKLRGLRIETGEIEAALRQHSTVNEAFVTIAEDSSNSQRLVAYVVPKRGLIASAVHLREHLQNILPAYMIPAAFLMLDKMPMGSHGKLDRHRLPAFDTSRPELTTDLVMPRNQLEQTLITIWSSTLGIDEIGIYDNFFELGGHSLLATQLVTQMQEIFSSDVPLLTLFFQDPTVAGLARAIGEHITDEQLQKVTHTMQMLDDLSDEQIGQMLRQHDSLATNRDAVSGS